MCVAAGIVRFSCPFIMNNGGFSRTFQKLGLLKCRNTLEIVAGSPVQLGILNAQTPDRPSFISALVQKKRIPPLSRMSEHSVAGRSSV